MSGLPVYSAAHVHIARCPLDKHCAFTPHLSRRQASSHCPLTHLSESMQSASALQSACRTGTHWPLSLMTMSLGQLQMMVRNGSESSTEHNWSGKQTLAVRHGFEQ